ncbi:hypothetical protein TI39_contig4417g00002 [Zymoseptoria brevis]|uniref:O-methyltransferase dimerisation domain-containing protein n=1 Tax=Zymoseptoria brevis TaxID=1047168 RepID=A0A0F4G6U3_9PEZI|nr:hypothetical protein TI39_contig4417g00002 [Zymoseptoria brevis]
MDSLSRQLALIDGSSFTNDEPGRKRICKAAAQLSQRLERPYEKVLRMVYTDPYLMAAVNTAIEMGLFKQLNGEAQSSSKLAKATGADVQLISRLLRILGSCGWVKEVTEDAFVGMELSLAAVEDSGMVSAIGHYFDVVATLAMRLPSF